MRIAATRVYAYVVVHRMRGGRAYGSIYRDQLRDIVGEGGDVALVDVGVVNTSGARDELGLVKGEEVVDEKDIGTSASVGVT